MEEYPLHKDKRKPRIDAVIGADDEVATRAEYHRIVLNFPPELAEEVRRIAERERRPMSKQIQVWVERALRPGRKGRELT